MPLTLSPTHGDAFMSVDEAIPVKRAPAPRNLWRVFADSLLEARRRQADQEIARYLALNGGKLTDSMERDIERHLRG